MKGLSKSFVAVSLFVSNIFFGRKSGYFDFAAEEKPLLHTWSLAVEEQYYVFFPIFLFLVWRFGKSRAFWTIVVLAVFSLGLSEWGWRNNATANFYLAPTRAWELFSGSIAAFIVHKRGVQANNVLSLVGLAAIVFAIFAYDETTPFPSVYALVPVVGVVLLVLYADKQTFVARLLSTKAFVGAGLISYSAYLWHQPLFAFARVRLLEAPSLALMCGLTAVSLIAAVFSWRYVERPFRDKGSVSRKYILVFSLVGLSFYIVVGVVGQKYHGFKNRFNFESLRLTGIEEGKPHIRKLLGCKKFEVSDISSNFCSVSGHGKNLDTAVFGDSHAEVVAMSLSNTDTNFVFSSLGGCTPFIGVDVARGNYGRGVCKDLAEAQFNFVLNHPSIKRVMLVGRWSLYTSGDYEGAMDGYYLISDSNSSATQEISRSVFSKYFLSTVNKYTSAGIKVYILLQVPQQRYMPLDALAEILIAGDTAQTRKEFLSTALIKHINLQKFNRGVIAEIAEKNSRVSVVSMDSKFCNDVRCHMVVDGAMLYRDDDHLSEQGAKFLSESLAEKINHE